MATPHDMARAILDANRYMTVATADAEGRPWASPVWYAHDDYRELLWVSRPDARHSRNLAARQEVAIVIFDSTVPESEAQALYVEATGEELADPSRAIEVYSRRSQALGVRPWAMADVTGDAPHRLYRATPRAHYLLETTDRRAAIDFGARRAGR